MQELIIIKHLALHYVDSKNNNLSFSDSEEDLNTINPDIKTFLLKLENAFGMHKTQAQIALLTSLLRNLQD